MAALRRRRAARAARSTSFGLRLRRVVALGAIGPAEALEIERDHAVVLRERGDRRRSRSRAPRRSRGAAPRRPLPDVDVAHARAVDAWRRSASFGSPGMGPRWNERQPQPDAQREQRQRQQPVGAAQRSLTARASATSAALGELGWRSLSCEVTVATVPKHSVTNRNVRTVGRHDADGAGEHRRARAARGRCRTASSACRGRRPDCRTSRV